MKPAPISQSAASAVQLNNASALIAEQKNQIEFLESVVDRLISKFENSDGKPFISRAEFNIARQSKRAPKDYSYDEYVNYSIAE